MLQIIQDHKNWKDAKKEVAAIKESLRDIGDIVPSSCKVYPCFDNSDTEGYSKDITIYETFCKDCRKFKILSQLHKAQQKQQAALQKLSDNFWKPKEK